MIGLIIRLSTYKSEMSSSALDQKERTEVGILIKSVKTKMSLHYELVRCAALLFLDFK